MPLDFPGLVRPLIRPLQFPFRFRSVVLVVTHLPSAIPVNPVPSDEIELVDRKKDREDEQRPDSEDQLEMVV